MRPGASSRHVTCGSTASAAACLMLHAYMRLGGPSMACCLLSAGPGPGIVPLRQALLHSSPPPMHLQGVLSRAQAQLAGRWAGLPLLGGLDVLPEGLDVLRRDLDVLRKGLDIHPNCASGRSTTGKLRPTPASNPGWLTRRPSSGPEIRALALPAENRGL